MKAEIDYINLMPAKEKKKPRGSMSWASWLAGIFVLAWLGVYGWQVYTGWELKKQLASLSSEQSAHFQELEDVRKSLGATVSSGMTPERAALVHNLLSERVLWSEIFKQFSQIVPMGLWFDNLEGSASERAEIKIRGGAFNYLSIAEFMLAMEKSGYFDNPQLIYAQKAVVQEQDVIGFEIDCGLKKEVGTR